MVISGNLDANIKLYLEVLSVCLKHGLEPLSSIEMENYLKKILLEFEGDDEDIEALKPWLSARLEKNFICLLYQPRWIQGSDWQFHEEKPMIFAGQIDLFGEVRHTYHDDTSIFVFIASNTDPVTLIQQF